MDKNAWWKWLIFLVLLSSSLATVWPPRERVKLGLDLRGGVSFVLQVKLEGLSEEAREDAPARALEILRNRIDPEGIREPILYLEPGNNRIVLQLPGLGAKERDEMMRTLQQAAYLEFRIVHEDNDRFVADLFQRGVAPEGYKIFVLDETLNGASRKSEFYVREDAKVSDEEADALREKLKKFEFQPGYEFMLERVQRKGQAQTLYRPYYVSLRSQLTGDSLDNAGVDYQQFGQPVVSISFNGEGADRFGRLTADLRPGGPKNPSPDGMRYLAIVLDGTLYSAPFIRTAIYDGNAIIEGSFDITEAQHLAVVLRAGSLPAPVEVIEERNVDPTLGRDSIRSGSQAAIYGCAAVMLFMVMYYLIPGLIADLSLVLMVLLLPIGMVIAAGFLGILTGQPSASAGLTLPTLTLPGIAGIALTIGMAVDANVLIYERMREELAAGKKLKSAIVAGYERAFTTILDSNLTTLLTAVILFWQGSGLIRGFAVTLSAGILVSMYVVLVITRMLFNLLAERTSMTTLHMLQVVRNPRVNFLRYRYVAGALSLLVILGSWTVFVMKKEKNFGVDFTGGRSLTFAFSEKPEVEVIRAALTDAGVKDPFIQFQTELTPDETGKRTEHVEIKVAFEDGERAKELLVAAFAKEGFEIKKADSVGPQVGHELRRQSVWAIAFGLLGIILYVSWRFEFSFAVGAIVALVHDVLVTTGIFCLLGHQLSLTIIAALLTIVGFSVNDTIVIFDRIREDRKLYRDQSFRDIANLSINQTLSRTLLTSFTVLLTVVSLLVFGGGAIYDFALAMFIGMIAGVYSTVYIATPVAMLWHKEEKPAAA